MNGDKIYKRAVNGVNGDKIYRRLRYTGDKLIQNTKEGHTCIYTIYQKVFGPMQIPISGVLTYITAIKYAVVNNVGINRTLELYEVQSYLNLKQRVIIEFIEIVDN